MRVAGLHGTKGQSTLLKRPDSRAGGRVRIAAAVAMGGFASLVGNGRLALLDFGAWRVTQGQMSLDVLLVVLLMGIEAFRPQRDLRALLHNGMMRQAADDICATLRS